MFNFGRAWSKQKYFRCKTAFSVAHPKDTSELCKFVHRKVIVQPSQANPVALVLFFCSPGIRATFYVEKRMDELKFQKVLASIWFPSPELNSAFQAKAHKAQVVLQVDTVIRRHFVAKRSMQRRFAHGEQFFVLCYDRARCKLVAFQNRMIFSEFRFLHACATRSHEPKLAKACRATQASCMLLLPELTRPGGWFSKHPHKIQVHSVNVVLFWGWPSLLQFVDLLVRLSQFFSDLRTYISLSLRWVVAVVSICLDIIFCVYRLLCALRFLVHWFFFSFSRPSCSFSLCWFSQAEKWWRLESTGKLVHI